MSDLLRRSCIDWLPQQPTRFVVPIIAVLIYIIPKQRAASPDVHGPLLDRACLPVYYDPAGFAGVALSESA